jgi:drug/metabolite transporter (DMT)-like permease
VILAAAVREYSHEMISSSWALFAIGAVSASLLMVALWALAVRLGDASHVDVGWAYGIGGVALLYAILADGSSPSWRESGASGSARTCSSTASSGSPRTAATRSCDGDGRRT